MVVIRIIAGLRAWSSNKRFVLAYCECLTTLGSMRMSGHAGLALPSLSALRHMTAASGINSRNARDVSTDLANRSLSQLRENSIHQIAFIRIGYTAIRRQHTAVV